MKKTSLILSILLLFGAGVWKEVTDAQSEMLDRHKERIKEKLPVIMDTWDPPNNEAQCVNFRIWEVIDKPPVNPTVDSPTVFLSSWHLSEKHDEYCGGSPFTEPNITSVHFVWRKGKEQMSFDKWCHTDEGLGKEFLPIPIIVTESYTGGCPEYIEGYSHIRGKWIKE